MKQIEEKKVTIVTKYEAADGTVFINKEECIKYEDTAKCVLFSRYNKLQKVSGTEYSFFNIGSEDYGMDAVKISSTEDVDLILQLLKMFNPHSEAYIDEKRDVLEKALAENDVVFINRGDDYNECFYMAFALSTVQNKLNSLFNETNKA